jgi:hydrogenase-4 component E
VDPAVFTSLCTLSSSLVLLAGIAILWRHSLPAYIDSFARQSFFFVLVILAVAAATGTRELYLVAALVFILKVVVIPRLLHRVGRTVGADLEIHPYVNIPVSLALVGILTMVSYAVAAPVMALSDLPTRASIPLALSVIFVGLFIVVSRRGALTQIVGFLVLENGIALLAVLATYGIPLIVELGVFLDVLLGVLVMLVIVHRIRETFETTDVDRLRKLRQ